LRIGPAAESIVWAQRHSPVSLRVSGRQQVSENVHQKMLQPFPANVHQIAKGTEVLLIWID